MYFLGDFAMLANTWFWVQAFCTDMYFCITKLMYIVHADADSGRMYFTHKPSPCIPHFNSDLDNTMNILRATASREKQISDPQQRRDVHCPSRSNWLSLSFQNRPQGLLRGNPFTVCTVGLKMLMHNHYAQPLWTGVVRWSSRARFVLMSSVNDHHCEWKSTCEKNNPE